MKKDTIFFRGYLVGCLLAISMMSLYQDYMGKEKYIEYVDAHWISESYTVPVAVCCIILCLVITFSTFLKTKIDILN